MDNQSESQKSRHIWFSSLMQLALEFDRTKLILWIAIRNTLGIAVSLILGFKLFGPGPAAFACMGALIVAFGDGDDAYRDRFRRIGSSGLLCCIAVFIAMMASEPHWLRLILVPLWGFAGAYALILGTEAADLGLFSTVMLIVYLGSAVRWGFALESSFYCLMGCAIQAAFSLTQWPRGSYRPEKRQVGRLFSSLSRLTEREIFSKKSPPLSWQFSRAQATLSFLSTRLDGESLRLRSLLNQLERLRLRLVTLLRLKRRFMRAQASPELVACFEDFYHASGRLMLLISETLRHPSKIDRFNSGDFSWEQMSDPGMRLRNYLRDHPEEKQLEPMLREAYLQMESVAGILRASAELSNQKQFLKATSISSDVTRPNFAKLKSSWALLRANFTLRSGAFRHGIRMAVCLAIGELILTYHPLDRGYWLPMTIALVLKPDFGTTFSRGILRMGGSLIGLAIATLLFHSFHPSWVAAVILLSIFTFFLRWIGAANYGLYSVGISAFIVLLTAIVGSDPSSVVGPRALNTLVGGALGLMAYLIWPAWEKLNGRERLYKLIEGYRNYCQLAFQISSSPEMMGKLDQARQASRLARANFESFILRMASEPNSSKDTVKFFEAVLASTNRLAHASMAVEADSKNFRSPESGQAFADYRDVLIFNLDVGLALLMPLANSSFPIGDNPKLAPMPKDLRVFFLRWVQAEQIDSTNLTHLAIELDRMTNATNTVLEQLLKFSANKLKKIV